MTTPTAGEASGEGTVDPGPASGGDQREAGRGPEDRSDPRSDRSEAAAGQDGHADKHGRQADQGGEGSRNSENTQTEEESDYDVDGNRRLRAEAERGFRSLHGTIGLGDHSITIGGSVGTIVLDGGRRVGPRARAIGARVVAQLNATLVETVAPPDTVSSRARLVDRLRLSPVALLAGPEGSGRTSLALCALAEALPEGAGTAVFDPGSDQAELTPSDVRSGFGYVLDVTAAVRRDGFDLQVSRLTQLARSQGVWFVLIVDATATALTGGEPVAHRMPDQVEVLRSLLDRRFGCPATKIDTLPAGVYAAVAGVSMARVVRVAALVAAALRADQPADRFLDEQVRQRVNDLLRKPLDGIAEDDLPRPAEPARLFRRAFLVALAVCNDMPLVRIIRAADRLRDALAAGRPGTWGGTSFTEPTKALLDWAEAIVVRGDGDDGDAGEKTGDGDGVGGVDRGDWGPDGGTERGGDAGRVRFRNPAMAGAIVDLVWEEHHLARQAMLAWLCELAVVGAHGGEPPQVRLRAAIAVGRLATHDFDLIMDEAVEQWIRRGSQSGQQAAAWAVDAMIGYPRIADRAWAHVRRWSARGALWRMTALRAYASRAGSRRTGEALDVVRRSAALPLGGREWARIPALAVVAMNEVASAGGIEQVFDLLTRWVEEIEGTRQRAERLRARGWGEIGVRMPSTTVLYAAGCLLFLASDDGPDGTRWALAEHVGADPGCLATHDELWRLLLTATGLAAHGWPLLRTWCEEADTKPERASVTTALITRLHTADDALARPLRFYADLWRQAWRESGEHPAAWDLIDKIFGPMGEQR
ncbi:hypothetical protein [Parafrankia sp. FMc2]|uniref:hypothetical protein n=1 Tax=Parafrankia sp. FMc2 TaxID=3233196 RepID=UPI0034D6831B